MPTFQSCGCPSFRNKLRGGGVGVWQYKFLLGERKSDWVCNLAREAQSDLVIWCARKFAQVELY
ncbi:hypothetical protein ANO14919_080870 [Xylariales sp. No.14919]|nr:hypothetical protein ANO14919_080870 [Xylariales sp. No.14919]